MFSDLQRSSLLCSSEIIMAKSRIHKFVITEDSDNDPEFIQIAPESPLKLVTVPQQGYCIPTLGHHKCKKILCGKLLDMD